MCIVFFYLCFYLFFYLLCFRRTTDIKYILHSTRILAKQAKPRRVPFHWRIQSPVYSILFPGWLWHREPRPRVLVSLWEAAEAVRRHTHTPLIPPPLRPAFNREARRRFAAGSLCGAWECAFRDVSDIRPSQETELTRFAHPEDSHRLSSAAALGGGALNSSGRLPRRARN